MVGADDWDGGGVSPAYGGPPIAQEANEWSLAIKPCWPNVPVAKVIRDINPSLGLAVAVEVTRIGGLIKAELRLYEMIDLRKKLVSLGAEVVITETGWA